MFASAARPLELPLIDDPENTPGGPEFIKKLDAKREEFRKFVDEQYEKIGDLARTNVPDYLVKIVTDPPDPLEQAVFFMSLVPGRLKPPLIGRWRRFVAARARPEDPVFGPWNEFMQASAEQFAANASSVLEGLASRPAGTDAGELNPLVLEALRSGKLDSKAEVARTYGELLKRVYEDSKATPEAPSPEVRQLREIIAGQDSPTYFQKSKTYLLMTRPDRDAFHTKRRELDHLALKDKGAPVSYTHLTLPTTPYV